MAKMSLREWINSAQKSKGLSTAEAKKNAGKYKSISSAKKAGSLYYTNKDGKVMIAATATDLNKPSPAKTKVAKPKLKSTTITVTKLDPPKRLTKTGGRGKGRVNKTDPESPSNKLAVKKILSVNPRNKANAKKRGNAVRTKNKAQENALSRYTFKQYGDMSVVKRKKLGLPPKLSLTQYMAKALQSDSDFKGTNNKNKRGPSGT
tara:strand:- start:50 stop:664 length:615 start_codon:yes stop_codon:yes gene_type:complete